MKLFTGWLHLHAKVQHFHTPSLNAKDEVDSLNIPISYSVLEN